MAPTELIQLEIDANIADFRWHESSFMTMLNGPVARDLVRRAIRVEAAAKRNATNRPGPRVITGRLRGSITWRLGRTYGFGDIAGPYVDVGTAVFYAPFLEFGTSQMRPYPFLKPALEAARAD